MKPVSLLGVLLDLLDEFDKRGQQPADVLQSKFFRRRRFLGSHDRRFIGAGFYSFLRHGIRGRLRWSLWRERGSISVPEQGRMKHMGALLALSEDGLFPWTSRELTDAASTYAAAQGGGWIDVFHRIRGHEFLSDKDWPREAIDRVACEQSLPHWLASRLIDERGIDQGQELMSSLLKEAPVDLRVHLSRVEREVVRKDLETMFDVPVSTTPHSPAGLRLHNRVNLRQFMNKNPGWIEVQDESSQLATLACQPRAGDTIIEACAGAGGKTLALADLTSGDATLHACDIDGYRLTQLERRARPLELRSLTLHEIGSSGRLPSTLPAQADLVIVDAPCSGLGSMRRNPDLKLKYDAADITKFAETQFDILKRFARRVKPGGRIAYFTCSLLREENQEVTQRFLQDQSDFELVAPSMDRLPDGALVDDYLMLDPSSTGTDGFFVAVFRKTK